MQIYLWNISLSLDGSRLNVIAAFLAPTTIHIDVHLKLFLACETKRIDRNYHAITKKKLLYFFHDFNLTYFFYFFFTLIISPLFPNI